jgi:hypothetical protein
MNGFWIDLLIILQVTILNGMGVSGKIVDRVSTMCLLNPLNICSLGVYDGVCMSVWANV